MSISLNSFDYNTPRHGAIKDAPYEITVSPQPFFGLVGAYVLIGKNSHRMLTLDATYYGYTTEALIRQAVHEVSETQGSAGTLAVNSIDWPLVVFQGFEPAEPPFYDGLSGKWIHRGMLKWLQVRAAP